MQCVCNVCMDVTYVCSMHALYVCTLNLYVMYVCNVCSVCVFGLRRGAAGRGFYWRAKSYRLYVGFRLFGDVNFILLQFDKNCGDLCQPPNGWEEEKSGNS